MNYSLIHHIHRSNGRFIQIGSNELRIHAISSLSMSHSIETFQKDRGCDVIKGEASYQASEKAVFNGTSCEGKDDVQQVFWDRRIHNTTQIAVILDRTNIRDFCKPGEKIDELTTNPYM